MKNTKVQLINEDEIISLTAEDGTQTDFYEVAVVEHGDELYVILEPATPLDGMEEGEVLIFKIETLEDDAEEDIFTAVEDETILETVFDEYLKAVADYDCECDDDACDCGCEDDCDCDDDCDCEDGDCDCGCGE